MENAIKTQTNLISRSFTLIEILIVCALIAMLTALAVAGFGVAMNKASEADTRSIMTQIAVAMDAYKAKYGFYPPSTNGTGGKLLIPNDTEGYDLSEFIPTYNKWKQNGTINGETLTDPYGTPFWFRSPGFHNRGGFDLESAGADTIFGYANDSEDDISDPDHDSIAHPDEQIDNINNWSHE